VKEAFLAAPGGRSRGFGFIIFHAGIDGKSLAGEACDHPWMERGRQAEISVAQNGEAQGKENAASGVQNQAEQGRQQADQCAELLYKVVESSRYKRVHMAMQQEHFVVHEQGHWQAQQTEWKRQRMWEEADTRRQERHAHGMQMLAAMMGKGQEYMQEYQQQVQKQQAERVYGAQQAEKYAESMPGLSTEQQQMYWSEMGKQAAQAAQAAASNMAGRPLMGAPAGVQPRREIPAGRAQRSPTENRGMYMPPPGMPPPGPMFTPQSRKQQRDENMEEEVLSEGYVNAARM
jgi:hypothetical protein